MTNASAIQLGLVVALLSGLWLGVWWMLPIGINDAEVGNMDRTGKTSGWEHIVWTEWTTDGLDRVSLHPPPADLVGLPATACRKGMYKRWAGSFTIYQLRHRLSDGGVRDVCARGPGWGTQMNMVPPWSALALGLALVVYGAWQARGIGHNPPNGRGEKQLD